LRAVVERQPDLAIAWWRLGETAFKQGRYQEADAAYARADNSASSRDRQDVVAHARAGRARAALYRGDAPAAERMLARVIALDPRFGTAHRLMAEALRAQGRAVEAERHATRATTLRAYAAPKDPLMDALADISRSSVFLLRYAASLDLGREAARREQLVRRALDADPRNPDVIYEMGSLLQQLRRPADALPYFERQLELSGDEQQTLVQIGKSYADLGRLGEAEATLRRALVLGDDAVGFYNLGYVLEQRDRLEEAESSYRRAIALNPGLARAHNNLGILLARRGRLDQSTVHLLESIRLDPTAPDAFTNLAAVMLERGAFGEAARYARLAIDADPRHADAHVNLGVALARLGDLPLARQHLDEALRIDPRHAGARANRDALGR
jgi:tetratricopeptide (TPR) repeat protein